MVVLQAAHRDPNARLHWDLDGNYLGTTSTPHNLATDLHAGAHRLTLTDHSGHSISTNFHVERSSVTASR